MNINFAADPGATVTVVDPAVPVLSVAISCTTLSENAVSIVKVVVAIPDALVFDVGDENAPVLPTRVHVTVRPDELTAFPLASTSWAEREMAVPTVVAVTPPVPMTYLRPVPASRVIV